MTITKHTNDSAERPVVKIRRITLTGIILGLVLGLAFGVIITLALTSFLPSTTSVSDNETEENKPLYWVAPMDANFRRDQPGQSPMGMDLIPYYGSQNNTVDEGAGTIKISPSVINNLGVRTTTATYSPLKTTIETVGYVTYDEDKLVHIHPRIAGWVEKLYINAIGDPVTKDQPL